VAFHQSERASEQTRSNTVDNFRHAFEPAAMNGVLGRMERNEGMPEQFMGNPEFRGMVLDAMMREFYQWARVRRDNGQDRPA
jgi:hypothetical protein